MSSVTLPDRVEAFIRQEALFTKNDRLLVGVSGGLDSSTLLQVLLSLDYNIAVSHCNFNLRGKESLRDEAFVQALAGEMKLTYHSVAFQTSTKTDAGESLQMTARRLRYDYWKKILDEYSYDYVITAHHLDDNLETFVINLSRAAGTRGLSGIAPARDRVRRPLLQETRSDIAAYARSQGLTWVEDRSNATDDYLRNRIRHHVVPALTESGLTPKATRKTLQRLRTEAGVLDRTYRALFDVCCTESVESTIVDRSLLAGDATTRAWFIIRLGLEYGFDRDLLAQIPSLTGSRTIQSAHGRIEITERKLIFGKRLEDEKDLVSTRVSKLPFHYENEVCVLQLREVNRPDRLDREGSLFLRPLPLPLHLRSRKNGDRIQPYGMGGKHKKVKQMLIDRKIPSHLRHRIPLLCDDSGRVIAVAGYRLDINYDVRAEDRCVLQLDWKMKRPDLQ